MTEREILYELHVKIEGTFDSALVGQDNYDAVSSASVGGASSNKNSDVTVYGAMLEKRQRTDRQRLERTGQYVPDQTGR